MTNEDPLRFLSIRNEVLEPKMRSYGVPWRGAREKSAVFFQILIEACSKKGATVADLAPSTGAAMAACQACGRNYFGLEYDHEIFDDLLKPLLKVDAKISRSTVLRPSKRNKTPRGIA
jgi:hypothetical protein